MKKYLFLLLASLLDICAYTQNVTITALNLDTKFKTISLYDKDPFFNSNFMSDLDTLFATSAPCTNGNYTYTCNVKTFEEKTFETPIVRHSSGSMYTTIFMTSGDRVSFTLKVTNKDTTYPFFEGKNAAHYNYATEEFLNDTIKWPDSRKKDEDMNEYKQKLLAYRDKRMAFLQKYIKKNTVSKDFTEWAKARIENNFLGGLYSNTYKYKEYKDVPKDFFDGYSINKKESNYYSFLCQKYIRYYTPNLVKNLDLKYVF